MKNSLLMFLVFGFLIINSCKHDAKNASFDVNKDLDSTLINLPKEALEKPSINQNLIDLEQEYSEMLSPIINLKSSDEKTYWFIVSWLKTAYKTPDWTGYYSEEWKNTTKTKGIDCSGFSRVMLDQIFNKQVAGGSQGILDNYCTRISKSDLMKGDLVFFRAPYSETDRIVHVGVYLQNDYFVHATSTKSAAEGKGLSINSLNEENWQKEFVSGGRVHP